MWYIVLDKSHPVDAAGPERANLPEQQREYRRQVLAQGGARCFTSKSLKETEEIVLNPLGREFSRIMWRNVLGAVTGLVCWLALLALGVCWVMRGGARNATMRPSRPF